MAKIDKPLMFGDATLDAQRLDLLPAEEDNSYVPGYSEQRRANEVLVSKGKDPVPIPRLQWIPTGTWTGDAAPTRDTMQYYKLGYRFVSKDDLDRWNFEMPPAAHVAADGTIRREDLGLAAVDWDTHQANAAKLHALTKKLEDTPMIDNPDIDLKENVRGIVGSPQAASEALGYLEQQE
jgi:hypothetical protein